MNNKAKPTQNQRNRLAIRKCSSTEYTHLMAHTGVTEDVRFLAPIAPDGFIVVPGYILLPYARINYRPLLTGINRDE